VTGNRADVNIQGLGVKVVLIIMQSSLPEVKLVARLAGSVTVMFAVQAASTKRKGDSNNERRSSRVRASLFLLVSIEVVGSSMLLA